MRKLTDRFIAWCADDSASARLERTIAQGIIGVAGSAATYYFTGDGVSTVIITPVIMAVLSPIQAAIGNKGEVE